MKHKPLALLPMLFLAGCAPPADESRPGRSLDEVLAAVRRSTAHAELERCEQDLEFEGHALHLGTDTSYRLRLSPAGRFVEHIGGRLGVRTGFDGERAWSRDWSGITRQLELGDLEACQTIYWVISGRWLAEPSPFDIELLEDGSERIRIGLRLRPEGKRTAELVVDASSWHPVELAIETAGGGQELRFEGYHRAADYIFPRRVISAERGLIRRFELQRIQPVPPREELYAPIGEPPRDTRFDTASAQPIAVERTSSGHLLVQPRIDGAERGWFILDSGAGGLVIAPQAADACAMEAFGEMVTVGASGAVRSRFRAGRELVLGPLAIADPIFVEQDLSAFASAFGVELAGICGFDIFARAVVELDLQTPAVNLHEPLAHHLAGASWLPLRFENRIPIVDARFEGGHSARFRLDSGAGEFLVFHSPAVAEHHLLRGRTTRETPIGGIGGSERAPSGTLAWFEIGGLRLENRAAVFSRATEGPFADPWTAGTLGAGLLAPRRLVLDYPGRRWALLPPSEERR